jgi:hypothetical protein
MVARRIWSGRGLSARARRIGAVTGSTPIVVGLFVAVAASSGSGPMKPQALQSAPLGVRTAQLLDSSFVAPGGAVAGTSTFGATNAADPGASAQVQSVANGINPQTGDFSLSNIEPETNGIDGSQEPNTQPLTSPNNCQAYIGQPHISNSPQSRGNVKAAGGVVGRRGQNEYIYVSVSLYKTGNGTDHLEKNDCLRHR